MLLIRPARAGSREESTGEDLTKVSDGPSEGRVPGLEGVDDRSLGGWADDLQASTHSSVWITRRCHVPMPARPGCVLARSEPSRGGL
jgi:hypothetical protein